MRLTSALLLAFLVSLAPLSGLAQEKINKKKQPKIHQNTTQAAELLQVIQLITRGKKIESADVKNVSFTIQPHRAFFTIEF